PGGGECWGRVNPRGRRVNLARALRAGAGVKAANRAGGIPRTAEALSRVPRMPRGLPQPRHAGGAWYCPFTLASGSDPRHESRVALLDYRSPRNGLGSTGLPAMRTS